VIIENNGLKIDPRSTTYLDSMYTLRTIVGEEEFGYYADCPGNDSLIWKNVKKKDVLRKMNVKLRSGYYFRDDMVPISEMKYSVQDTSVVYIDTIVPNKNISLSDQALIRFKFRKDGQTTITGVNSQYRLNANIIVRDNKIVPTGFPKPEIKHYSSCKCKS